MPDRRSGTAFREGETRPPNVTCVRCGWVSYAIGLDLAKTWSSELRAEFLRRQPAQLGRAPTFAEDRYSCLGCRGTEFREFRDGDCPNGCTVNPVICVTA